MKTFLVSKPSSAGRSPDCYRSSVFPVSRHKPARRLLRRRRELLHSDQPAAWNHLRRQSAGSVHQRHECTARRAGNNAYVHKPHSETSCWKTQFLGPLTTNTDFHDNNQTCLLSSARQPIRVPFTIPAGAEQVKQQLFLFLPPRSAVFPHSCRSRVQLQFWE